MALADINPVKSYPVKISFWNFAPVFKSVRLSSVQILVLVGTVKASPQIGEILPFGEIKHCEFFFTFPSFFSILRLGRIDGPIFTLYG